MKQPPCDRRSGAYVIPSSTSAKAEVYLTASNELDPTLWIGSSLSGQTVGRYNDTSSICTANNQPYAFCGWSGSYIVWDYRATNPKRSA